MILKIEEEHFLADRKFRNYFEHYDEKVEEFFDKNPTEVYADLVMNPSLPPQTFKTFSHRGYNTFNSTLEFRGEEFDFVQVMDFLAELKEKCRKFTLVIE